MKLADKLKAIEEKTYQVAMLQAARSYGGFDACFYAAVLDGLADRDALKRGCDELQRLAKEYCTPLTPEEEKNPAPAWSIGLSDAEVLSIIFWEVFTTTPRAWRLPGGESALLNHLRAEDETRAEMSNSEYKKYLNSELERLAMKNP